MIDYLLTENFWNIILLVQHTLINLLHKIVRINLLFRVLLVLLRIVMHQKLIRKMQSSPTFDLIACKRN